MSAQPSIAAGRAGPARPHRIAPRYLAAFPRRAPLPAARGPFQNAAARAALAAGAGLAAPAIGWRARSRARRETLLVVSESGPKNLDIHGVGTSVPGWGVSGNCYDRLIRNGMKTLEDGKQ